MDRLQRRRLRKRGVGFATSGLGLAVLVGFALILLGRTRTSYGEWLVAVAVTLAVQGLLWLVPHLGWDEKLAFDPHYIYTPTLVAAVLLSAYVAVLPEIRVVILTVWFVALLFAVGRAGFVAVVGLSSLMAVGYMAAAGWRLRHAPESLGLELTTAGAFMVVCTYAGFVFERLRRERGEMRALRRSLAELALTDSLTGLPNRRQFEESLRNELSRSRRHGGRFVVAMVDVDHFKNYNDLLGHPAGDAVLRELAQVIRDHLRSGDVGARYGGEEFALLLTDSGCAEGLQTVDRLRAVVAAHPFARCEVQPERRLTISAGVAAWPEHAGDTEALVRRADEALYLAKSRGRNRVLAAE